MKLTLPPFSNLHLIVVGDVMLDRYFNGHTSRISPEAPVPIVHISDIEDRPGGAGNVALNIVRIGASVSLFACCGQDEAGRTLNKKLQSAGVKTYLQSQKGVQTILKQRVLSLHQQLIRLDFEDASPNYDLNLLFDTYIADLPHAHAVVFSDYGKGMAVKAQAIIASARKLSLPVVVDPKGADFSLYRGATVLTPNRKEFEVVMGVCRSEEEMHSKAIELIEMCDLKALLVTRGEEGMSLFLPGNRPLHLTARKQEVYDVTGAGDTVAAFLAMALAANEDFSSAVALANLAAGIAVGKLGAATISLPELQHALLQDTACPHGIMTQEQCRLARQTAKIHGERVVMTNGCFDILHAGHVAYLEEAKALGDRLVVAVNDDASVARLKGSGRPINDLGRRMSVLAGLSSVDWVVPFSQDTPAELISELLPDILVKGGDYKPEQLAGAHFVIENGGEVKILQFLKDCSTTQLIHKIQLMGEAS